MNNLMESQTSSVLLAGCSLASNTGRACASDQERVAGAQPDADTLVGAATARLRHRDHPSFSLDETSSNEVHTSGGGYARNFHRTRGGSSVDPLGLFCIPLPPKVKKSPDLFGHYGTWRYSVVAVTNKAFGALVPCLWTRSRSRGFLVLTTPRQLCVGERASRSMPDCSDTPPGRAPWIEVREGATVRTSENGTEVERRLSMGIRLHQGTGDLKGGSLILCRNPWTGNPVKVKG